MAQTAPPYLSLRQAGHDHSPRLGSIAPPDPPSLDTAAKRTSYRPPIPPKPSSRTASPGPPPHNMASSGSRAHDDADVDDQAAPPSRETSPTLWMRAMARDRGMSTPSPPPSTGDARSAGARTPRSARGSPMIGSSADGGSPSSPSRTFPSRPSPRMPPAVPPRPVNLSSPTARPARADNDVCLGDPHLPSASSCPQTSSPFASLHASDAPRPIPTITTSPSRSPDRWRSRPPQHPGTATAGGASTLSSSASYNSSLNTSSSSSATSAFNALGRGLQQAKLKDRLGAGVGFARDWGGRGKGKLQDGWRGLQTHRTAASVSGTGDAPYALASPPLVGSSQLDAAATGAPAGGPGALRLPTTIYGVHVPIARGVAFGASLVPLVERTRAPPRAAAGPASSSLTHGVVVEEDDEGDDDPVTGSSARHWLPGAAFRLLEYLELWGPREEGVYRVPGSSHMVAQLRCMYDAGVGQELDLREIGPADLDPHAVASAFKGFLREIPDPLLSHQLEPTIDALTTAALGHPASSSHFLSGATVLPSRGSSPAASPNPASAHVPPDYVAELRTLFTSALPAEHFYLLRAIAFHLARLAAHEHTNKMSLNNLRLILSPTLRFTPGFVNLLVGERDALFGGGNDDGRARRDADASSTSGPAPSLAHASSSSSSLSTSRSFAGDRWLVIDEPPLSLSPSTAFTSTSSVSSRPSPTHLSSSNDSIPTSTRSPSPQQTPIADRFASASTSPVSSIVAPPPPPPRGASPAFSASSTAPILAPKPSLPPLDRPDRATPGSASSRARSAVTSTSSTSSPPLAAAPSPHPGSTPRLSLGPEFRSALAGLDGPLDAPAPAAGLTSAPTSSSSPMAAVSAVEQEALEREKDKARKKARRESRALSGVGAMPLGVGLGLVTRPPVRRADEVDERHAEAIAEGDELEAADAAMGSKAAQRWTLLSVDERRRLFGG